MFFFLFFNVLFLLLVSHHWLHRCVFLHSILMNERLFNVLIYCCYNRCCEVLLCFVVVRALFGWVVDSFSRRIGELNSRSNSSLRRTSDNERCICMGFSRAQEDVSFAFGSISSFFRIGNSIRRVLSQRRAFFRHLNQTLLCQKFQLNRVFRIEVFVSTCKSIIRCHRNEEINHWPNKDALKL